MSTLRFLLLEDSLLDAELLYAILTEGGIICELVHVKTKTEYQTALEQGGFDLILSDYCLPGFNGIAALEIAQELCPDVPFIFVTATMGEEVAIETLKKGAIDYVLKQRIKRLVPSVRRSLREAEERRARLQAEAELHRREQEFRALVENSPDIIARFDKNLRNIYVNPAVTRATGLPPEKLIGKDNAELGFPEEICASWHEIMHRVFATGEGCFFEFYFPATDGIRYYQSRLEPEFAPDGSIKTILSIIRDVTDYKQAEQTVRESEAKLRQQKEELEKANRIKDEFLAVLSHELRSPMNAILGWSQMLLTRQLDQVTIQRALETIERNAQLQTQLIDDLLDISRIIQGTLTLNRVPTNLVTVIQAAINTVSLAAQAKSIDLRFSILDFGLSDISKNSNSVMTEEQPNNLKSRHSHATCYNEGNPRNAVAPQRGEPSEVPIVRAGVAAPGASPGAASGVARQRKNLRFFRPRRTRFAIGGSLRSDFSPHGGGSKIQNPKLEVLGDPNRIQQIVWNLLSNAIKFTPPEGKVEVLLESIEVQLEAVEGNRESDIGQGASGIVKTTNSQCPIPNAQFPMPNAQFPMPNSQCPMPNAHSPKYAQITVTDTGIGIKPDFLPYVFDYFRQADSSTTRQHGGLGIGLAIARHLVELHGGTIFAESPGVGKGATFRIRIPLLQENRELRVGNREKAPHSPLSPQVETWGYPHSQLQGVRVLFVDDNTDTLEFLVIAIEQFGAIAKAVTSAKAALEVLPLFKPDVLVSDIGMPDEDGYSLIRQLRKLPPEQGGKTPAIAVTAYARESDRHTALIAGFQEHLAKPIMPNQLATMIGKLVNSH